MSETWRITGAGLTEIDRLAAALACIVRRGDVVTLSGDLGAGKTTLARALIRHLAGDESLGVPSPTYTLVQDYDTPRMPVRHVDLYRVEAADELDELGLEDGAEGLLLVEWPERGAALPGDRLDIALGDTSGGTGRDVRAVGHGTWSPRLTRLSQLSAFLAACGWPAATLVYMQGDASVRAFARVRGDRGAAILMDSPALPDGPPIRDGKPYSQLAHLAEDVRPFVAVADALRAAGLAAPDIYGHDFAHGFLLLEDLGATGYAAAMDAGTPQDTLYAAAVDVLAALRANTPPAELPLPDGGTYHLPHFDIAALQIEAELLVDWLWPALNGGAAIRAAERAEFTGHWRAALEPVAADSRHWVLRDYHSPNLLWRAEREGTRRVGVVDFQDAMRGSAAYDLVSLLQDARLDVPADLEAGMRDRYCLAVSRQDASFSRDDFETAYAILGAQRSTKILGIFARLAMRDGKRAYLGHMPRVAAYLARNLDHPALAALKGWYDAHFDLGTRNWTLDL